MRFRGAVTSDLDRYFGYATVVQQRLADRGLTQFVPAAHAEYHDSIARQVEDGELFVVEMGGVPAAFFRFTTEPSEWWAADTDSACYLSGIVVAEAFQGNRIGERIIEWAASRSRVHGRALLRLDCHAGNPWLCNYYENLGFHLTGTVLQHPGYRGCLYERVLDEDSASPA